MRLGGHTNVDSSRRTAVAVAATLLFFVSANLNACAYAFSAAAGRFVSPSARTCAPFGRGYGWVGMCKVPTTRTQRESSVARRSSPASDVNGGPYPHPGLSREEIEQFLANVPVYAVTISGEGGIVLLSEEGNENSIAYFFFDPETANSAFAPLRAENQGAVWDVTGFSLGAIWFELLDPSGTAAVKGPNGKLSVKNGVEYRLVPNSQEIAEARRVVDSFGAAYNEIPVFIDQRLRIGVGSEAGERVPMYLGVRDLLSTCRQLKQDSSLGEEFKDSIDILDLRALVQQMQEDSEVDFRKAVLIPASPRQKEADSAPADEAKSLPKPEDAEPFYPSTTGDWSD